MIGFWLTVILVAIGTWKAHDWVNAEQHADDDRSPILPIGDIEQPAGVTNIHQLRRRPFDQDAIRTHPMRLR